MRAHHHESLSTPMLMYSFGINAFGIRSEQLNVSLAEDSLKKKKKAMRVIQLQRHGNVSHESWQRCIWSNCHQCIYWLSSFYASLKTNLEIF